MNKIFQKLLRAATWLAQALHLTQVARAMSRWLDTPPPNGIESAAGHSDAVAPTGPSAPVPGSAAPLPSAVRVDVASRAITPFAQPDPAPEPEPAAAEPVSGPGVFSKATHVHDSQAGEYKLYTPPDATAGGLALVVMLHGCTQDPDDFAAGTGMNERARELGFFVLYPAQSEAANAHRCWNWFSPGHQQRDSGEPAWIAALTRSVVEQHRIDPRRVFIAGLSAGGAMAAVVAEAYPDLFAAVGVHSGLPVGAASNVMEAIGVMRSGATFRLPWRVMVDMADAAFGTKAEALQVAVPTIVFHGDEDETVHPRNGEQIIAAVMATEAAAGDARDVAQTVAARAPQVEQGEAVAGRRHTRTVHRADDGTALAEHWLVHGAGHAWSGGLPSGSFTDANGPDATREMLRFFFDPLREKKRPDAAAS